MSMPSQDQVGVWRGLPNAISFASLLASPVLFALILFGWLFHTVIAISVIAYVEEILLLYLLPTWTSDIRGLYWVLPSRREGG